MSRYSIAFLSEKRDELMDLIVKNGFLALEKHKVSKHSVKEYVVISWEDFVVAAKWILDLPENKNLDALVCFGSLNTLEPINLSRYQFVGDAIRRLEDSRNIPIIFKLEPGRNTGLLRYLKKQKGNAGKESVESALSLINFKRQHCTTLEDRYKLN